MKTKIIQQHLFLLLLLVVNACPGSSPLVDTIPLAFPDGWSGTWQGKLEIWSANEKVQTVPMRMEIGPGNNGKIQWLTVYGEGPEKEVRKPYLLEVQDAASGHYRIDEQNTILIECFLFGRKLLSWYKVQHNLILVTHELVSPGEMIFEVVAGSSLPVSVSGATGDIPEVETFPVKNYQRAVLKKQ